MKAQESLSKAQLETVFNAEQAFLEDSAAKTDEIVTNRLFAARDLNLISWINAPGETIDKPNPNSWERIQDYIGNRSMDLLGQEDALSDHKVNVTKIPTTQTTIFAVKTHLAVLKKNFLGNGGKAKNLCDDPDKKIGVPEYTKPGNDEVNAKSAYQQIVALCEKLKSNLKNLKELKENPFHATVTVGDYYETTQAIREADELIETTEKLAKSIKVTLDTLTKNYECALKAKAAPDQLAAAATMLTNFLDMVATAESDARKDAKAAVGGSAGGANVKGKVKKGEDCGTEEHFTVPSVKELLEGQGLSADAVARAIKTLRNVPVGNVVADTIKQATSRYEGSKAQEVLEHLSDPTKTPESADIKILARTFDLITKLQKIAEQKSESAMTDVLLIDISYQKFKSDTANIELAALKKQRDNLEIRRAGILNEIRYLWAANDALSELKEAKPDKPTIAQLVADKKTPDNQRTWAVVMLRHLRDSWNYGRLPQHLTVFKESQIRRDALLNLDEAAFTARTALLKPVVDQLAEYGKGGIKSEQIARILSAIGITATAVGVNR